MRIRILPLAGTALSLSLLPAPPIHALSCPDSCYVAFSDCFNGCSQCDCYSPYEWCLDQCQYFDSDGDGVPDVQDNCPEVANSNQGDCDFDGIGTACDSLNGTFTPLGPPAVCASDRDNRFWGYEIEVTYQQAYIDTSSCRSGLRNAHIVHTSSCIYSENEFSCCQGATEDSRDDWICRPMGQYRCSPQTLWP